MAASLRRAAVDLLATPRALTGSFRSHARAALGASWLAVAVICSIVLYNYASLAATPASVTAVLVTVASLGLFTALTTVVTAALLFRSRR